MNRLKPRYVVDLPKHLADCECNYHRLLKLMPSLESNAGSASDVTGAQEEEPLANNQWRYSISGFNKNNAGYSLELSITTREIAKYTTMLDVCVSPVRSLFPQVSANKPVTMSNNATDLLSLLSSYTLNVRLYHDAQLAEVVSSKGCLQFKARHQYPNQDMHQCDEKSQLNQFLGELIVFCLVQGRVTYNVVSA